MYLIGDTETTGFFNEAHPAGSPIQPHICQLGAELCTEDGRVVASMNLLVKPHNWGVPPQAQEVHGISTAMCEQYGLPLTTVMGMFGTLVRRAKLAVFFRRVFDHGMIWTELIRSERAQELADYLALPGFCAMEASIPVMKLPPTQKMIHAGFGGKPKTPNLQEAHEFYCGSKFDDAHDAFADVQATRRVFFEMKKRGLVPDLAPAVAPARDPSQDTRCATPKELRMVAHLKAGGSLESFDVAERALEMAQSTPHALPDQGIEV